MAASIQIIARVSAKSVQKHTGKNWDEWIRILNRVGAQDWPYREICLFLKSKYKLSVWWQGAVTIGFETYIGRRIEGRSAKGEYSVSVTKSLHVSSKKAWKFLESDSGQAIWLKGFSRLSFQKGQTFETEDGFFGEVRTIKSGERLRMTWQDPEWEKASVVQMMAIARPGEKCILIFACEKIRDTRVRAMLKERWRQAADEIAFALPKSDRIQKPAKRRVK
jgi:hypothetical protein